MNSILFGAAVLASFYILFCFFHRYYFLRDPYREIPDGKNIVCPADGKIVEIKKVKGKQKVKKGDYIVIDNTEGKVQEVDMQETKIKTKEGDVVLYPNSLLIKHKIIKKKK